jgi:hypothetical protein
MSHLDKRKLCEEKLSEIKVRIEAESIRLPMIIPPLFHESSG